MLQFLRVYSLCLFTIALAQAWIDGCPSYHQQPGLKANFYWYQWEDYATHEPKDWFLTWIKRDEYLGSQNGITQPNFKIKGVKTPETLGNVYGFNLTVSNFAMELIGYYRAPVTGIYIFKLKNSDNGVSLQLGLAKDMSCCSQDFDSIISSSPITLQWKRNPAYGKLEVHMVQGHYYPIRLAYYNQNMGANLKLLVRKPGETKPSDNFTDSLFGPGGSCIDPPESQLSSI